MRYQRPHDAETKARCIERIRSGENVSAIAASEGVSRQTLYTWAHREGIK